MIYRLFVPSQAVGANVVHFDLFNANGSASELQILWLAPIVDASVAVAGSVGISLFLTRTTAVGTGGTAATNEGSSLTAATFTGHDTNQAISPSITARLTPTGGATAGAVISYRCVFGEETNAAAYNVPPDMAAHGVDGVPPLIVPEGSGIRVVQSSVASAGSVAFGVIFKVRPKGGS